MLRSCHIAYGVMLRGFKNRSSSCKLRLFESVNCTAFASQKIKVTSLKKGKTFFIYIINLELVVLISKRKIT